MNVQFYCICSHNISTQRYINNALMQTSSHSVYQATLSDNEVTYLPIDATTPLQTTGFVMAESFADMLTLKSKGVRFVCLDEDLNCNIDDYQPLNPVIFLAGSFTDWILPEHLLKVIKDGITKSYRMQIRFSLGIEYRSTDFGEYDQQPIS